MPLLKVDIGDLKRVYKTNVLGIILTVQPFAPFLIAAASNPRRKAGFISITTFYLDHLLKI
jgi:1-acylglycerone phosphate reductase